MERWVAVLCLHLLIGIGFFAKSIRAGWWVISSPIVPRSAAVRMVAEEALHALLWPVVVVGVLVLRGLLWLTRRADS